MGLQEYLLLALVILLPLVIAVVVTLWTLEQARLRSKKNRKRPAKTAPPTSPHPQPLSPNVGEGSTPSVPSPTPWERVAEGRVRAASGDKNAD